MTSFKVPRGSTGLTQNTAKALTVGTSSLFQINGPVAIDTIFGVVTTAVPAAAITFRLQHSSSLSGVTYVGVDYETFFEPYPAGTWLSFSPSLGGFPAFGVAYRGGSNHTQWYSAPGTIQITANNATPAFTWYLFWTPLHPTSSVVAL